MSLGQKMRAELAATLIHELEIVYLDEPTIGLDLLVTVPGCLGCVITPAQGRNPFTTVPYPQALTAGQTVGIRQFQFMKTFIVGAGKMTQGQGNLKQ